MDVTLLHWKRFPLKTRPTVLLSLPVFYIVHMFNLMSILIISLKVNMFFHYIYLQFSDIDIVYFKYFPITSNLQIAFEVLASFYEQFFSFDYP